MDLVTRVISMVTIVITAYNPNYGSITVLTKSHQPPRTKGYFIGTSLRDLPSGSSPGAWVNLDPKP